MEFELLTENLELKLSPDFYIEDITYPTNTIMGVNVYSDGFCASTSMDIDLRELAVFSEKLCQVYDTLSGEARIEEPYGLHMYLQFIGDGKGHISVKGLLHGGNRAGNEHTLEFENSIDQTELRAFCFALRDACNDYFK